MRRLIPLALALLLVACQAPASNLPDGASAYQATLNPLTGQQFYFVLADRFANGDTSNDTGGLSGDRLATGYDPTDIGFFHGGDLKGLLDKLDYIQGLGTTALWIAPVFANQVVQGTGDQASAGYHGYWVTDFTKVDPHLGSGDDLRALVDAAHQRGMKVYLDVIANHTADLISLQDPNGYGGGFVSLEQSPYRDAAGADFDPRVGADQTAFPTLDAKTSFPYVPQRNGEVAPACLSDVTVYHNRGNIDWGVDDDEMYRFGDFSGLDDLMTENPAVLECMSGIYEAWIDFGIDGYRVDTGRHVNMEFWTGFTKAMREHAAQEGREFFEFAEVYLTTPSEISPYIADGGFDAALDFPFQEAAISFASGGSASVMRDLFDQDGVYQTATTDARAMVTFLGNHDMGRVGYFLANTAQAERRSALAHALMFLSRGQPVVYYGDEQGFVGEGGDKAARQDMFGNAAASFTNQTLLDGSTMGSAEHYSTNGLYAQIAALGKLRSENVALRTGVQQLLSAEYQVLVFSRYDPQEKVEYVVALNSSDDPKQASFKSLTPGASYSVLWGDAQPVSADGDAEVALTVPAIGGLVLKADRPMG
ncbi:MAG: hypothetical protein LBR32_07520 [Propionibacteriaceae bacterium]|jgi:glycosidase|nr:hypothetical protein [Propionibacteriaceae bacterium]